MGIQANWWRVVLRYSSCNTKIKLSELDQLVSWLAFAFNDSFQIEIIRCILNILRLIDLDLSILNVNQSWHLLIKWLVAFINKWVYNIALWSIWVSEITHIICWSRYNSILINPITNKFEQHWWFVGLSESRIRWMTEISDLDWLVCRLTLSCNHCFQI